jgi:hypothetical protein
VLQSPDRRRSLPRKVNAHQDCPCHVRFILRQVQWCKARAKVKGQVVCESSDDDSTAIDNEDDRSEGYKLESQPVTDNLETILTPKVTPIYLKPTSVGSAGKKIVSFLRLREVAEKVGVTTPTHTVAASIVNVFGAEVWLNEEEEEEVEFQKDEVPTAPAHKNDSPASSEKKVRPPRPKHTQRRLPMKRL